MKTIELTPAACAVALALALGGCDSTVVLPAGQVDEPGSTFQIVERLTSEPCMPHSLVADAWGRLPCIVVEARRTDGCACDPAAGRASVSDPDVAAFVEKDELTAGQGFDCMCEIVQLDDGPLGSCQNDPADLAGDGWCYIDAGYNPPLGNPELVAACPESARRSIRFVGQGEIASEAIAYLACSFDAL